jgi:anti-sigma factor RsiW
MKISLELLGAFVDGELDEQERVRVEAAVATDAALAAEVARIRQLGGIVAVSFDGLLSAPVPAALSKAVQADAGGNVVQFVRPRLVGRARLPALRRWRRHLLLRCIPACCKDRNR